MFFSKIHVQTVAKNIVPDHFLQNQIKFEKISESTVWDLNSLFSSMSKLRTTKIYWTSQSSVKILATKKAPTMRLTSTFTSPAWVGNEIIYSSPDLLITSVSSSPLRHVLSIDHDRSGRFLLVWGYLLLAQENNVCSPNINFLSCEPWSDLTLKFLTQYLKF